MRVSHPNLLCVLLHHKLRVAVFLTMQSLSLLLVNKLPSAEKRKDHCEMATDCSSAKRLPPKMRFFAFVKLSNHCLFGIPR